MGTCTSSTSARVARSSMENSYSYLSPGICSSQSRICGVKPRRPVWVSATRAPVARAKKPTVALLPILERSGTLVPSSPAFGSGLVRTPRMMLRCPATAAVSVRTPTRKMSRGRCWPSASAVTMTSSGRFAFAQAMPVRSAAPLPLLAGWICTVTPSMRSSVKMGA